MTSTWSNIPSRCADGGHRNRPFFFCGSRADHTLSICAREEKKEKRGVMLVDGFKGTKQQAVQQF